VTGNPSFDKHYDYIQKMNEVTNETKKIRVGFASNNTGDENPIKIFRLLSSLCEKQGLELILRRHPNEIHWTIDSPYLDMSKASVEHFLSEIDFLVSYPSTILLEAQIYGISCKVIGFSSLNNLLPIFVCDDNQVLYDINEINKLTFDFSTRKTNSMHMSPATPKIMELIKNLLPI
ncbi:MAG: hypothetical protein PSV35_08955, partial [bacterium]|nr:hypothetical protein [bacterium]